GQLRFGDQSPGGRENVRIDLDGLQHRLPPALPPHHDHRIADVRSDFEDVARLPDPNEHSKELTDFRVVNRMHVRRREGLQPRQQRIASRRDSFEIFGLRAFEDGVGAAFHLASTASRSFSAWKWAMAGSMMTSRLPSMIDGRLWTVRPMR